MSTVRPDLSVRTAIDNPDRQELQRLTELMPNARRTDYGNLNIQTRAVARSKRSTFLVDDDASRHSDPCIGAVEGVRVAQLQDAYLKDCEVVVIDGYIGSDPDLRVSARLIMEATNANIAAMQQQLYFDTGPRTSEPQLTVIYTPNLAIEGYQDDRLIAVDLDRYVTRVFNSDYFGESKKAGLRMWNKIVYDRGGLALHAGCKVIPVGDSRSVGLIIGLSGTGKTTTTFTRQNNSFPVQDDFVALMPDGRVLGTENGCFAKTFGLEASDQPEIYAAVTRPEAYLENVAQHHTQIDFFDHSYTQNGRAVFPMSSVPHVPTSEVERADFVLFLNRNDNLIPAVARLSGSLAAAYFMLGETKGTSAGGAAEAGKFLRIPGTNPFFPLLHAQQGNRFLELLKATPLKVYLMNTGRVGGGPDDERSRKVEIRHSSAIVRAIAEESIKWEADPDFGYEVATTVPGLQSEDEHLLRPAILYEQQGRGSEYREIVKRIRRDRLEYLRSWDGLDSDLLSALG